MLCDIYLRTVGSTYLKETMSEIYDTKELPEVTFPLSFKIVDRYQWKDSIVTEKLNSTENKKGSFRGILDTIKLVTFKNKIVIPQLLQRYVVKWYHTYILHTGRYRTQAMIHQHFYWPGIRKNARKEVTKCDVCQLTKRSTKITVKHLLNYQKKYHGINYVYTS